MASVGYKYKYYTSDNTLAIVGITTCRYARECFFALVLSYTDYTFELTVCIIATYSTDLMQHRTRKWHALESNLLCTRISSVHDRVQVDALVIYAWRKHSKQAITVYFPTTLCPLYLSPMKSSICLSHYM